MRQLNAKQKKALDKWIKESNPPQFCILSEDMPEDLYWEIYRMNEHENFDSNAERYISDHAEPTDYMNTTWRML